jgi:hypothetical protein
MLRYRQSSSMSLMPLVAPVYLAGWGQAGPKSTACKSCQPLCHLGGFWRVMGASVSTSINIP